jgi:hypothetical protein
MDGFANHPTVGKLFAEDFDSPEAAPEPEVIDPVFTLGELSAARATAWHDGHAAGLQEAAETDAAATRQALTAIVEQFAAERDEAAARAEQSAEAIARLLTASLAATFPTLCARHGDAEVRAIVRTVLPALTQETAITVRAHPRTAAAVTQEIARLDPDLVAYKFSIAMRCRQATCGSHGTTEPPPAMPPRCGSRWRRSWRLRDCCGRT